MYGTFSTIAKNFKLKPQEIIIDNLVFRMHYRITTLLLMVATILVTSRQYIGEHIKCMADKGVPGNVMETFCFFTTTFTVPRHHTNATMVQIGALPHPGVGPMDQDEDFEFHHNYYQWVPFVLFGQALAFYAPHYIWKRQEGGRMKKLASGFQYMNFSLVDKEITVNKQKIPTRSAREKQIEEIKRVFIDRLHVDKTWSLWLVFCEILNAVNLILQVYFTNKFLSGQFYSLGPEAIKDSYEDPYRVDILDVVFPKVTKCTFHKYGPSGTIQAHDALCVMALNIINEKIYTFLWFWFAILAAITLLGLLWRALTVCLHSRSVYFNRLVFSNSCPGRHNPWEVLRVTKEFHFSDWLFLYYLSKNMDGFLFLKLFVGLAESMEHEEKPLLKSDLEVDYVNLQK